MAFLVFPFRLFWFSGSLVLLVIVVIVIIVFSAALKAFKYRTHIEM